MRCQVRARHLAVHGRNLPGGQVAGHVAAVGGGAMGPLGALPWGHHVIQGGRHHGGSHGQVGLAGALTSLRQVLHRARPWVRLETMRSCSAASTNVDMRSSPSPSTPYSMACVTTALGAYAHPLRPENVKPLRAIQLLRARHSARCCSKAHRTWSSRTAGAADAATSGPLLGSARWAGAAAGRTEIPGMRCARAVHLVSGVGAGCPAAEQGGETSGRAVD